MIAVNVPHSLFLGLLNDATRPARGRIGLYPLIAQFLGELLAPKLQITFAGI